MASPGVPAAISMEPVIKSTRGSVRRGAVSAWGGRNDRETIVADQFPSGDRRWPRDRWEKGHDPLGVHLKHLVEPMTCPVCMPPPETRMDIADGQ